ncbi:MAG: hypothetical protein ACLRPR_08625 [Eisenbergiella sp.]
MQSELSKTIDVADVKAQYDAQCKRVLSQREILARILKEVAEEFRGMELEEIAACIEGEPEISSVKAEPGKTNPVITGISTESTVSGEGSIYYDIRFCASVPGNGERIRLIINVEAQKDYYPGYQIPTRGVFYCARMVSSQMGTEFVNVEYRMEKRDIIPGFPDIKSAYDKLSVIVIGLCDREKSSNELAGMLNVLLSPDIPAQDKKKQLAEKYDMKMEDGLGKEVDLMCNLSGYVEKKGMERGIEQGIGQGLEALVQTLKPVYDFEKLYEAVVENPIYAHVTREEVRRLYEK